MPRYDYICETHQFLLEFILPIGAAAPKCSICDEVMIQVYTTPAVHFKGEGWGKD